MSGDVDLERFVLAQDSQGTYDRALQEIRSGRKSTHWMWFVFPQVAGLGRSSTAQHYAVSGLEEARAYLAHPVLGARLRECCQALLQLPETSPQEIFGGIDAIKLGSSMTLFSRADPGEDLFVAVLDRFFEGRADQATDDLLARQ